ncbi:MAG: AMP-binding protein [Thioalkalispiraceae bacterium]|jgi:1-acyl-sn-glycerol-3-phosphate acyltransferase
MTNAANIDSSNQDDLSLKLLSVIEGLVNELQPSKRSALHLSLDSSLDEEIGLDSLGRVELIARLEQKFNIALPQRVFVEAETPRDLLRAITSAHGSEQAFPLPELKSYVSEKIDSLPNQAQTLIDVLEWHVKLHPERLHVHILGDEAEEGSLTYKQLWDGALKVAAGLQKLGIQTGETVAIMLPSGKEYFFSFFAILLTGAIPVPIYPPARRSQLEEHLRRHSGILNNCRASMLITIPEAKVIAQLLKSQVTSLRDILTVNDLSTSPDDYIRPAIGPYEIAFIQYTSGSTGNPKGVVLTHANLLANIRAMGEAIEADSSDVFISWLPLYHDMGLIGAWLGSMYYAVMFVVMSPLTFLTRPQRWLWAMHHYRGTLSASPNFGYELVLKRISDSDIDDLDLSNWRCAFNGAEPVSPNTIDRFTQRLSKTGFKTEAMLPVYGLAESSVGLIFPPLRDKPRIDCVERELFTHTRQARPADESDQSALCFVTCGQPLAGHQIRIVDDDGNELPERQEGRLQFRGPSATSGYYRNPEATKKLFNDDWLDTGDLAYQAEGYLFVTGRSKDLIIRAGRNIYPQEVEEVVGNIDGVRRGCVVTFGTIEAQSGTERLVLIAESRHQDGATKQALQKEITSVANDLIGLPPDEVIIAPPHTVLKTSSGKIRRSACRELYEKGQLGKTQAAVWLQVTRTVMRSVLPIWHRLKQKVLDNFYAAYGWLLFYLMAPFCWLAVVLLPMMSMRWMIMRGMAKTLAVLSGTRIKVNGLANLFDPKIPCIFVANHQSYLDGMLMVAAIPRMFRNVAKIELKEKFVTRLFLNNMGVEYVERFDKQRGLIDAQRITEAARQKQSLFFFPEGTFQSVPGLMNFHMGAFLTAVEANVPIIPISIRGTRTILRGESKFPHRGSITVTIGEAISQDNLTGAEKADKWTAAISMRDMARKHILRYCGEPVQ